MNLFDYSANESDFIVDLDEALSEELLNTPWEARLRALTSATPLEERVALYQELHHAAVLPREATFFLLAWAVESLASEQTFTVHDDRYALYPTGGAPAPPIAASPTADEVYALSIAYQQESSAMVRAMLQAFGEYKMAALHCRAPKEFANLYDAGYAYFFGATSESDAWEMKFND